MHSSVMSLLVILLQRDLDPFGHTLDCTVSHALFKSVVIAFAVAALDGLGGHAADSNERSLIRGQPRALCTQDSPV